MEPVRNAPFRFLGSVNLELSDWWLQRLGTARGACRNGVLKVGGCRRPPDTARDAEAPDKLRIASLAFDRLEGGKDAPCRMVQERWEAATTIQLHAEGWRLRRQRRR